MNNSNVKCKPWICDVAYSPDHTKFSMTKLDMLMKSEVQTADKSGSLMKTNQSIFQASVIQQKYINNQNETDNKISQGNSK